MNIVATIQQLAFLPINEAGLSGIKVDVLESLHNFVGHNQSSSVQIGVLSALASRPGYPWTAQGAGVISNPNSHPQTTIGEVGPIVASAYGGVKQKLAGDEHGPSVNRRTSKSFDVR
jgi:hypothetical protein